MCKDVEELIKINNTIKGLADLSDDVLPVPKDDSDKVTKQEEVKVIKLNKLSIF